MCVGVETTPTTTAKTTTTTENAKKNVLLLFIALHSFDLISKDKKIVWEIKEMFRFFFGFG